MRALALGSAVLLGLTACATGAPVGGRSLGAALRYRAATPPSAPRAVPPASPARRAPPPAPEGDAGARSRVVAAARTQLGVRGAVQLAGRRWPPDCTGLVHGAYAAAGVPLSGLPVAGDNAVTALYRRAQADGRLFRDRAPQPGDLAFFRETYDLNRDGRLNDGLTHVALVEAVDRDGTVSVLHRVSRGVVRSRLNLARRHLARDPKSGEVLNDVLRAPGPGRPLVLTGELLEAYGALLPAPAPSALAGR